MKKVQERGLALATRFSRNNSPPLGGTDITIMGGKEPVVPVEVEDAILSLAVHCYMKLFYNRGSSCSRLGIVRLYISNEDGKHLSAVTKFSWRFLARFRSIQHYIGVTKVH
jgi:hypothetical protein